MACIAAVMRQGMARMTTFFAQPFPFEKYDEVLIPGLRLWRHGARRRDVSQ